MSKLKQLQAKYPNSKITKRANGSYQIGMPVIKEEKSRTQQEFKDEVNIVNIMKKYNSTGIVSHIMQNQPMFDDISEVMTYQEALNLQIIANQNFAKMPSKIRAYFGNKPENLIEFLNDSKNKDEAIRLGLIEKPQPIITEEPKSAPPASKSPEPEAIPPK